MTTWNVIRETEDQLHKAALLDDAIFALDYCFQALQRLGCKWDDLDRLLSDDLRAWCRKEMAAEEALQRKYQAAMAEKKGKANPQIKRKRWPPNVVPLRGAKGTQPTK